MEKLRGLASSWPIVGQVRGKGLFIGIEIVEEKSRKSSSLRAQEIKRKMVERGYLLDIFGPSSLRLTPPLIIEKEHVDSFVECFGSVLKEIT
jgi:4-aminobutyrate aminotransferase-like enzyme